MAEIHDLDIYGRELNNGVPYVLDEYETIEQGLKLYLSYINDRIYYPEYRGVLKRLAFKQINNQTLIPLKFDIQTDILNGFVPNININALNIIPDKQNRLLKIELSYTVKGTQQINTSIFYVKNDNIIEIEKFEYRDIDYTEENLYLWVQSVSLTSEMLNKKLIYNYDENCWTYGKYRLIHLTTEDIFFSQILQMING